MLSPISILLLMPALAAMATPLPSSDLRAIGRRDGGTSHQAILATIVPHEGSDAVDGLFYAQQWTDSTKWVSDPAEAARACYQPTKINSNSLIGSESSDRLLYPYPVEYSSCTILPNAHFAEPHVTAGSWYTLANDGDEIGDISCAIAHATPETGNTIEGKCYVVKQASSSSSCPPGCGICDKVTTPPLEQVKCQW